MPSIKEVFEGAKAAESEDPSTGTQDSTKVEEKPNNEAWEAQIAQAKADAERARKEAETFKTEALKLRQDLSENVRLTQSILNKSKSESTPTHPDFTDDELEDMLANNPAKYHKVMKKEMEKTAKKIADSYVDQFQRSQEALYVDSNQTKIQLAKMRLAEKYEGVEDEWQDLIAFGDKFPQYTANTADPKHLEAFYLMYKGTKGESAKKRDKKADTEALLKKMSGGLNTGIPAEGGDTKKLTPEEDRIRQMYNMSVDDYVKYKDPTFTYDDYKKSKGGKK